jgi:hypothetical protein
MGKLGLGLNRRDVPIREKNGVTIWNCGPFHLPLIEYDSVQVQGWRTIRISWVGNTSRQASNTYPKGIQGSGMEACLGLFSKGLLHFHGTERLRDEMGVILTLLSIT